jgi:hypothetical protein
LLDRSGSQLQQLSSSGAHGLAVHTGCWWLVGLAGAFVRMAQTGVLDERQAGCGSIPTELLQSTYLNSA